MTQQDVEPREMGTGTIYSMGNDHRIDPALYVYFNIWSWKHFDYEGELEKLMKFKEDDPSPRLEDAFHSVYG